MSVDPVGFLERAVREDSTEDVSGTRDLLLEALREAGHDPRVDVDEWNSSASQSAARSGDVAENRRFSATRRKALPSCDAAGNVRATRGAGSPHVVFNTHIDTVAPHVPFEREGDVIRGRGASDAKGPLAALLSAFLDAEWDGAGTLTLAVTPDEEVLSTGAHALMTGEVVPGGPGEAGASVEPLSAADPAPDAYVVGEPTGLDVCTAARGRFEGTVAVEGVAAHAASPESGVNAVSAAGRVLAALETFENVDEHPQLGAATLVPTGIDGGESTNQVPADCEITIDRRSVPPETATGFRDSLEAHLRGGLSGDGRPDTPRSDEEPSVSVSLAERETPFLEAFATDPDAAIVAVLADAATEASVEAGLGERGTVRPFGAATEASYFAPTPTVVFGPGHLADDEGAVAHAKREYVDVASVRAAAAAIRTATERLLGADGAPGN